MRFMLNQLTSSKRLNHLKKTSFMTTDWHKFSIKQVAAQAGVSKATVDRVRHNRGLVHHQTIKRVEQALKELHEIDSHERVIGRTFYIDVVMHAPIRFSKAVQEAMQRQVGAFPHIKIRPRFHLYENVSIGELHLQLKKIAKRGSQGIILKAPDEPLINNTVNQLLSDQRIPTVTLVTDLPTSERLAYVGIDNKQAGETAAYLIKNWLKNTDSGVLIGVSHELFRGEEQRAIAFSDWMKAHSPGTPLIQVQGSEGVDKPTYEAVTKALSHHTNITAVYSAGGANRAILKAFEDSGQPIDVFIGHDLDRDNKMLIAEHKISAVIHHDLNQDARSAFMHILKYHRSIDLDTIPTSKLEVITPYNQQT